MKNIKIFRLLIVLMVATACNDYLKEENPGNVVADEFYTTPEGYESLVYSTYATFRDVYGRNPYIFTAGTDMYVNSARSGSTGAGLREYRNLGPGDPLVADFYQDLYVAIQRANTALYYNDVTAPVATLDAREGEVRFIRAHHYFLLVQTFGAVPLVIERIDEPVLEFERTPETKIYEFIISEMETALGLVPEAAEDEGRVDKRAIRHFLAKVHLTRGHKEFGPGDDFETAATYADAAIAGQGLTLPFEEVFRPGNENNEEIIFAVQYSAASMINPIEGGHFQSYQFGPYMGGSEWQRNPYRSYDLLPTWYVYQNFEEGDERYDGTFMLENNFYVDVETGEQLSGYYDYYTAENPDDLYVSVYFPKPWEVADTAAWRAANPERRGDYQNTVIVEPTPQNWEGRSGALTDRMTPAVKKFDDPASVFSGNGSSTRDIFIARLAETYLIAAEAYLMAGNPGTAADRINEVRRRAGASEITGADVDIDFILDERARELVGEYHRWYDLVRTGTLVERTVEYNYLVSEEDFIGPDGNYKILRPIPTSAINLNQAEINQNPGY
jgi:hypothetical protein